MLAVVAVSLPAWLRLSRFHEKRTLFCAGALWWIAVQAGLWVVDADAPAFAAVALIGLAGVGYGVTDLMPWSMLGDVTDEDELRSGERREGIYAGFFTFLRKLGGATGVALASVVLQLSGYEQRAEAQPESALLAIRALTVIAPAVFLAVAIAVARGYPLTRERLDRVQAALAERQALARGDSSAPR
jgi:GPH family glycoside/pentoside/hexuronide:cation symporter